MIYTVGFYVDSVPFTPDVVNGTASLGGSESACLGLARALSARGHRVTIYATKLDKLVPSRDRWGVRWMPAEMLQDIDRGLEWDVFCSLRMPAIFHFPRNARLRILWNQDLMNRDAYKQQVMSCAWAYDKVVYVSEFHRQQWEEWIPELKLLGHVTKNGYDPAHVPAEVTKDPHRIIHISRPERGLEPILAMWPALKAQRPQATLRICRYNSMYDEQGWGQVCKDFDRRVEAVNQSVGGITYLGELGKAELYQQIAEAAVMWYPGVPTFAETSCIAALEAQANGTPFVGSLKGALPETVPSGILVPGDAFTPEYQQASIAAVVKLLDGCQKNSVAYRKLQTAGRQHVTTYTYDAIAQEWEEWLADTFTTRYENNKLGVLRQLLHYDDHTAALRVAEEIIQTETTQFAIYGGAQSDFEQRLLEPAEAVRLCTRVLAGKEHQADDYAARALDPISEAKVSGRMLAAKTAFTDSTHVLDLACGAGACALALTQAFPNICVTGVDYSPANIATAKAAAELLGVADRCTFIVSSVYDFETQQPWHLRSLIGDGPFDGAFVGEFLEHCGNAPALVDAVEAYLQPGSPIVWTVPYGPLGVELNPRTTPLKRSHVHHFGEGDLRELFSGKKDLELRFLPWAGQGARGAICGNWLIGYHTSGVKTPERPYAQHVLTTRPYQRLSVGIIAKNAEFEIGKCLDSVWGVADEIVIGLCGSTDGTKAIATAFDAPFGESKIRCLDLPRVEDFEDGFSGARNAVLAACTGDWFLWIDTDEQLVHAHTLGKHLDGGAFVGFVIHQTHLQLDAPMHHDSPVRLFRRVPSVQFYGCIHEQPQRDDCNGEITPALELNEAEIAHVGYLTNDVRRGKMVYRNLPMLQRDQDRFPTRRLGRVLVLRDYVNLADLDCEQAGDRLTERATDWYQRAITLYQEEFSDPADKYHDLSRPFYERALKVLKVGSEIEVALAGQAGGLNGTRAKPRRMWVQDADELEREITFRVKQAADEMRPKQVRVDPFVPQGVSA